MEDVVPGNRFGLRLIGGFKLFCGILLVGLGVGLFRNAKDDPALEAEHLVKALRLDPGNYYIHTAIEKVSGVKPSRLREIGVGTFFYALLYVAEGGGLLLRKRWAEYLTVVATGLFIPLEIYEIIRRPTPIRIGLLLVNVAIVAYVVRQIKPQASPESAGAP